MLSFVKALKPRSAIASAVYNSGLWRGYTSGAWVVSYHGVIEEPRDPWLESDLLPLDVFRDHLDYFQRHRVVVPLHELLACIADGTAPDPRFVVLCFDDALASLQEHVVPELTRRRMPFVIGVPAALPGTGRSLWEYEAAFLVYLLAARDTLPDLVVAVQEAAQSRGSTMETQSASAPRSLGKVAVVDALTMLKRFLRLEVSSSERIGLVDDLIGRLAPELVEELQADRRFCVMDWAQLEAACSVGGSLAAHGYYHHPHNSTLTDSCRTSELRLPMELIRQHTGVATNCFIWPEGSVDKSSIEVGMGLGYKYFLSSRAGRITSTTSPTDVPRVSGQWPVAQVLWNAAMIR